MPLVTRTAQRRHVRPIRLAMLPGLLALAALLGASCSPTRVETGLQPGDAPTQELPVQMGSLKSVQTRTDGQDPQVAFAVAISGGGERAANFGVGVLLGLESLSLPPRDGKPRNALGEVDYLSTVSGGGFVGATYVVSRLDFLNRNGAPGDYSLRAVLGAKAPADDACDDARTPESVAGQRFDPCLRHFLEHDYQRDIERCYNPLNWKCWAKLPRSDVDRTNVLEASFDALLLGGNWRCASQPDQCAGNGQLSVKLKDLFEPATSPGPARVPYWVANATTYEDANIFPFTPDHLKRYQVLSYTHRLKTVAFPPQASRGAGYEGWISEIPVALAVTASGNFPAALPATTFGSDLDPANPYLHLLDGGLADNLGVVTAVRLLKQDRGADKQPIRRRVLVVVDAFPDALGPYSRERKAPSAGNAINRTTTVALDAWHARYRELVQAMALGLGIDAVISLSFEDLNDPAELERMKALEVAGIESLRLDDATIGRLLGDLDPPVGAPGLERLSAAYRLLRNVPTSYSISNDAQRLLIAAGRRVVQQKASEITAALTGTGTR